MADKKIVLRILAVALVFGLFVVGCSNTELKPWTNVTDLKDVAGTWKASYSKKSTLGDMFEDLFDDEDTDYGEYIAAFMGKLPYQKKGYVDYVNNDTGDPGPDGLWDDQNGDGEIDKEDLVPLKDAFGEPIMVIPSYKLVNNDITVEEAVEETATFTATSATAGTAVVLYKTVYTFSGDSLDQELGYDVNDPAKKVRDGWALIKFLMTGSYATPYPADYTVNDKDHTITTETTYGTAASPAPIGVSYFDKYLISPDKKQMLRDGNLYTK